jgi:hypothetical protein
VWNKSVQVFRNRLFLSINSLYRVPKNKLNVFKKFMNKPGMVSMPVILATREGRGRRIKV